MNDRQFSTHAEARDYGEETERLRWAEALAAMLDFHMPDGMTPQEAVVQIARRMNAVRAVECLKCGDKIGPIYACARCDQ